MAQASPNSESSSQIDHLLHTYGYTPISVSLYIKTFNVKAVGRNLLLLHQCK
jgi:hypothetical protein